MEGDQGACGDLNLPCRTSSTNSTRRKQGKSSNEEKEGSRRPNVGDGDCKQNKTSKTVQMLRETARKAQEELHYPSDIRNCDRNSIQEGFTDEELEYDEIKSSRPNMRRFTSNDEPKPNLIVNYLPQTLSDKDFFHLFAPFGTLESIKIMRDSETCYSFGYGFVNYFNLNDAIDARNEMNGMQLGHKRIKVSFARPPSDDIKDTNLFVTGLPQIVTESELEEMFSPFGVIVHLRVLRDRKTGLPRGVAFVRFETRSEACAAIFKLNGTVPEGAKEAIRVRLAQDHGKQKAAYLAGYQAALKMNGGATPGGTGSETARAPLLPPRPPTAIPYAAGRPRNINTSRNRPLSAIVGSYGSQIPKATSSVSDQTLYWRGFLHGAREPRRADSLNGRALERRPIPGPSRLRF